jgi:hypothetical protein
MESGPDLQGLLQPPAEFCPRDFNQTKLFEVRIVELCVQKHISAINQARGEMDECNL